MSFLKALCCGSSSPSRSMGPAPRRPAGQPPAEKVSDPEAAKVPTPPAGFTKQLSEHPETSARELLQPYLEYELWLRKAFASGGSGLDGLANLVPLYGSSSPKAELPIRNIDRDINDKGKYLMRLPDSHVNEDGSPAIVPSFDEYRRNFEAFTHSSLKGLDWSNVVVAGSSALLPLLPRRGDVTVPSDPAVEDPVETYYQRTAGSSDIDMFIYGLDEEAAIQKIAQLETAIRENQRLAHGVGMALRTEHAITFVSPKWPYRHVQIILRLYKSISEILTGFDVDCACVAFDGQRVYANPRSIAAIATRTNLIDLSRRSPSYENRLYKYRNHRFDAYWHELDRTRVDPGKCTRTKESPDVQGLARLIFFEEVLKKSVNPYRRRRLLKTIDENGEPTHSGYATLEIPYGERFTATRVRKFVALHSKEPCVFGTVDEVLNRGATRAKKNQGKLKGRVKFLKDDPGRQMIGSFYPLTQDDW
ncbi:hypothetical protein ACRE_030170 [Hapsidospora chrysogenum ATCC 11550]|uniref:Uncharacterized protein n=1 Tax=Hapsidospora chrysogenum (strain ATCC 11550 / CBS 779.69 / DSM 880 / IAM 14645 / JCM 23072 / IMI 49137) TaxID=857340 RepID=A0A086TA09_HAPC1|nr:hypothetical protein ACRE_030170 [Hapsidospora chrysogenum ATCC 11550]